MPSGSYVWALSELAPLIFGSRSAVRQTPRQGLKQHPSVLWTESVRLVGRPCRYPSRLGVPCPAEHRWNGGEGHWIEGTGWTAREVRTSSCSRLNQNDHLVEPFAAQCNCGRRDDDLHCQTPKGQSAGACLRGRDRLYRKGRCRGSRRDLLGSGQELQASSISPAAFQELQRSQSAWPCRRMTTWKPIGHSLHRLSEMGGDAGGKRVTADIGQVFSEQVSRSYDIASGRSTDHLDVMAFPIDLPASGILGRRSLDCVEIADREPEGRIGSHREF